MKLAVEMELEEKKERKESIDVTRFLKDMKKLSKTRRALFYVWFPTVFSIKQSEPAYSWCTTQREKEFCA